MFTILYLTLYYNQFSIHKYFTNVKSAHLSIAKLKIEGWVLMLIFHKCVLKLQNIWMESRLIDQSDLSS